MLKSKEFKELDDYTQRLIQKPTVPAFELATVSTLTLARLRLMIDNWS